MSASTGRCAVLPALQDGALGLYNPAEMRLADGACKDCRVLPQASWYFPDDLIAVPGATAPLAGFSPTDAAQRDVRLWAARADGEELRALPTLIWLGSSQVIPRATLAEDGRHLTTEEGQTLDFAVTPKIPTNLSYYDATSQHFYAGRPLRLRGEVQQGEAGGQQFVARTLWPLDFSLPDTLPLRPLEAGESLQSLVRAEGGGAKSPYAARVLWERSSGQKREWADKAVLGVMLNGAQGDDDEAHGGHFGIVTGRYRADGDWSRWLVNNFYNLDSYSEKGIVAAVTPMDKYLMDLNNGQSFYRPSYLLVAVLRKERTAQQYQAAINRVYNHLYRHDFVYSHAKANCSGISVDTFRSLGWNLPERGSGGQLKAIAAYFYVAATSGSLGDARKIYDYLTAETTRLYPAAAFDAMGEDLLNLAQGRAARPLSALEQQLGDDLEALLYVHIPQIPSSRAFGLAPVYSFDEYMGQAPADRSQWKIVPTEPRPFPDALRDGLALQHEQPALVPLPVGGAGLGLMVAVVGVKRRLGKRGKKPREAAKGA
ncbi:MAG: hypothetical protein KGZ83_15015 [Sulfuricella sp.]|nr:hypothetical protein [Sulfuricella sp.]